MIKTAVIYGSSSGNTEAVAEQIADKLSADVFDINDISSDKFSEYKNLILGTSTWGIGDLQDDWDAFLPQLESADLEGKTIALFGLGDAMSYPDSFVDGIGILYKAIENKGCKIVGQVDPSGYDFDESEAFKDGKFVGLPIDEDSQGNLTDERVEKWVEQIKGEFR